LVGPNTIGRLPQGWKVAEVAGQRLIQPPRAAQGRQRPFLGGVARSNLSLFLALAVGL